MLNNYKRIIGVVLLSFSFLCFSISFFVIYKNDFFMQNDMDKSKVDESLINELFNYIPVINSNSYSIFKNSLVTMDDLPIDIFYSMAYKNLKISDFEGSCDYFSDYDSCQSSNGRFVFNCCYIEGNFYSENYYFSSDTLKRKLETMYGNKINWDNSITLNNDNFCSCNFKDDYYFCYCDSFSDESNYSKNLILLDNYEILDDEIIIYVKYLFAKYRNEDESGTMYVDIFDKENGTLIGFSHTFSEKVIFDKYENNSSIYKAIFKKNDVGIYNWYSIEPVDY